jgi:hypothetical protein
MARLLVVHHSPSAGLRALLDSVLDGTAADGIVGVEVEVVGALEAAARPDVLDLVADADACLLGTPVNLGYLSGALKHFFDVVYKPSLGSTRGRPYGAWIHGESDTTGATLALEKIVTGLEWRAAQPVVELVGPVDDRMRERVWELGAAVAAGLMTP